jgi:hypothetical protein
MVQQVKRGVLRGGGEIVTPPTPTPSYKQGWIERRRERFFLLLSYLLHAGTYSSNFRGGLIV